MNGDGLPDRVVFDRLTPQYKTWKVYFNNGSGFDNGTDWSNPSAWSYYYGNYIRNTGANGTYTDLIDMNGGGIVLGRSTSIMEMALIMPLTGRIPAPGIITKETSSETKAPMESIPTLLT
jgi:hypothetical protein